MVTHPVPYIPSRKLARPPRWKSWATMRAMYDMNAIAMAIIILTIGDEVFIVPPIVWDTSVPHLPGYSAIPGSQYCLARDRCYSSATHKTNKKRAQIIEPLSMALVGVGVGVGPGERWQVAKPQVFTSRSQFVS